MNPAEHKDGESSKACCDSNIQNYFKGSNFLKIAGGLSVYFILKKGIGKPKVELLLLLFLLLLLLLLLLLSF